MDSKPTALVTVDVSFNIDSVWPLFYDFDAWNKWWALYTDMFAYKLDADGKKSAALQGNEIPLNGGYYRQFTTIDGTTWVEYLKEFNPLKPYTLNYDYVSVNPPNPAIESITSRITLEKKDEKKTTITWCSWTKVTPGTDQKGLDYIVSVQEKAYQKGLEAVEQAVGLGYLWKEGLAVLQDRIISMEQALLTGQNPVWEYVDQFPGENGVPGKPFPRFVRGLPTSEALPPKKVGKMLGRFLEVGYLQAAEMVFGKSAGLPPGTDLYKVAAKQVIDNYGRKDLQEITDYLFDHAAEDAEFCQQALQGCNPLQIRRVMNTNEVPETMQKLTAQDLNIQQLITQKRLFILDYKELANLKRANTMFFHAPIVLLYKEILNGKSQLKVLAIQLLREPNAPIYQPNGPHPLRYKLARLFAAVADNQVHEFKYHLGIAHLGMEPIIIAVHNALPENHAVRELLNPHLQETIGINFLARQTLIAKVLGFTDKTFAVGTKQGVELASDAWGGYDFYKFSFPNNLKERGFSVDGKEDGLEGYLYRDDGAQLWEILGKYAKRFVKQYYRDDDDIKNDKALQAWAHEMSAKDRAAIPGFKSEIKTREELELILQIIIWNGSVLHSFLNFL